MIAVDFMSFARKIPKKFKLKNYRQLAQHLWNTFSDYRKNCTRLDIIFDLYLEKSIKHHERNRRSKQEGIATQIIDGEEQLPIDMDKFWALEQNKVQLQQFFIKWMKSNYSGKQMLYLGGSHPDNMNSCLRISGNESSLEPLLLCYHEEADVVFRWITSS